MLRQIGRTQPHTSRSALCRGIHVGHITSAVRQGTVLSAQFPEKMATHEFRATSTPSRARVADLLAEGLLEKLGIAVPSEIARSFRLRGVGPAWREALSTTPAEVTREVSSLPAILDRHQEHVARAGDAGVVLGIAR